MFELHVYNFHLNLEKKNHAVKLVMNTRTYTSSEYNFFKPLKIFLSYCKTYIFGMTFFS